MLACSKACILAKQRAAYHAKHPVRATPVSPSVSRAAPARSLPAGRAGVPARSAPADPDGLEKIREADARLRARREMETPNPNEA
jgi:hypothetical protein